MTKARLHEWLCAAALGTALVVSGPVAAHHSTAMFDDENPIELTGTVVEWQFSNPHCFIILDVDGETGEREIWSLEGMSPNVLYRQGWTPNSLQPGDRITVTLNPLQSGAPGGNYRNPRWEDGTPIEPKAGRPE